MDLRAGAEASERSRSNLVDLETTQSNYTFVYFALAVTFRDDGIILLPL
jgi:hypothetical protein